MKRFKVLYMVLVLLLASNLFASEAPIRISAEKSYNELIQDYIPEVKITSVSNNVTIKNVLVNKGNCEYSKKEVYGIDMHTGFPKHRLLFPKKLSYGKELKITLSTRCNIMRVDVETNQGDWSVEY